MTNLTSKVSGIPKFAAEDTSLVTGNIHGEKTAVPVPKGTDIVIDTPGIHYNRTYLVVFINMKLIFSFFFSSLQNKNTFSSLLERSTYI